MNSLETVSRYLNRVAYTLFFVVYLMYILKKYDLGFSFIDNSLTIKIALLFVITGLYSIIKEAMRDSEILKKINVRKIHDHKFRDKITNIYSGFSRRFIRANVGAPRMLEIKRKLKLKNLYVSACLTMLAGICLFILTDIFSQKPTNDYIALLITLIWIICSQVTKLGGRLTILGGIILLCLSPFFVIYKMEVKADKSAVWAFMFFTGGLIQQILTKDDTPLLSAIINLKKLVASIKHD